MRKNGTPRGERSKETILEAALPLFARQGYRGASLASIASAAGLTQPGLLHHFPSKEELLLGLLDPRAEGLDDPQDLLPDQDGETERRVQPGPRRDGGAGEVLVDIAANLQEERFRRGRGQPAARLRRRPTKAPSRQPRLHPWLICTGRSL